MVRLKDRQRQIPNGFRFRQPETGWESTRFASFDTIVNGLIQHRLANPYHAAKSKWATTYDAVAAEVDYYNARVCVHFGWQDYITTDDGGPPPPKWVPPSTPSRVNPVKAVAAGAETLLSWLGDGGVPVSQEQADQRAAICIACALNVPKTLADFFTVSAQAFIHTQLEKKNDMKLSAKDEDKLGICSACACPMKLKVWTPISHIKAKLPKEVIPNLDPSCWVTKEMLTSG